MVVVSYAWLSGYIGNLTGNVDSGTRSQIVIENVLFKNETHIEVSVRNVGDSTATVSSGYVDGMPATIDNEVTISAKQAETVTLFTGTLSVGSHTLKVVCKDGFSATTKATFTQQISWWDSDYGYRRQIFITNNAGTDLKSGYTVKTVLNTASLVSEGKMLPAGNDLRVCYWDGSNWTELDRDVINMDSASTEVWFKTQADISTSDSNYYIYYDNPSAGSPPAYWSDSMGADLSSRVYLAADDFQEHNSGNSPDGWDPCDGYFKVGASGSDRFMNSTASGQYVFAGSSAWTDYVVKIKMQAPTGSVSYPGIAVRVTNVSNLVYFGWRNSTTLTLWKRIGGGYTLLGDWTIPNVGTAWHAIEIRVKGQDLYVYHDGTYYGSASLGAGELTSGKVGIFSSYGTHAHWDDCIVREYVSPEPSTSLGLEESS